MLEINNIISCVMLTEVYVIYSDTLPCLSGLNSHLDTLLCSYLSGCVEHFFQPLPTSVQGQPIAPSSSTSSQGSESSLDLSAFHTFLK